MATKITDLSHDQAFDFLMKPEQYCTTELPEYFDFSPVLDYCKDVVNDMDFPTVPDGTSGVNLDILTNKDGKYGMRPLSIPNPFLFTFLAKTSLRQPVRLSLSA